MEIDGEEIKIYGESWFVEEEGSVLVVRDEVGKKITYGTPDNIADWAEDKYLKLTLSNDIKMETPKNHGKKWTDAEHDDVFKMLDEGKSFAEIAEKMQRSERAVYLRVIDEVLRRGLTTEGKAFAEKYSVDLAECEKEQARREERKTLMAQRKAERESARVAKKEQDERNSRLAKSTILKREKQESQTKIAELQGSIKVLRGELAKISRLVASLK